MGSCGSYRSIYPFSLQGLVFKGFLHRSLPRALPCRHAQSSELLTNSSKFSVPNSRQNFALCGGLHPKISARMGSVDEAKCLISEMCRNFYTQGWVSGTGGGMSVKVGDRIVMAPSGVQKERMVPEDTFVLDAAGNILETPKARPAPQKPPKLSECSPLFMAVSTC